MVKDVNGKFDDYSVQLRTIPIFLHCGYELAQNDLL